MVEEEKVRLADATVLVEASKDLALRFVRVCPCCQKEFPADAEFSNCPADGNLLAPVSSSLIGSTIDGRYTIERLIAVGAWSEVYLASQTLLEKKVAIKILHLNLLSEPTRVSRFEDEAKAASRLKNSSIVSVHDFGLTADARPFIVMDYVEGASLAETLQTRKLTPEQAAQFCVQLARALQEAHKQGIVHRDVKPANIIVTGEAEDAVCQLLDFGVAKTVIGEERADVTRTGEVLGTPAYMSPEQCRAQAVDARSDIYSLGCVFYEMLAGERLVKEGNSFACMKWHMNEMPPEIFSLAPMMPSLSAIAYKMLEKNPDDRYQSMEAVVADLELAQFGGTISAPPRRRLRTAAFLAAAACLLGLIGFWFFQKGAIQMAHPVPAGQLTVASTPVNQVERYAVSGFAERQLQAKFENMRLAAENKRKLGKVEDAKYIDSQLAYYQSLYFRKLPLPQNELAQEFVVSVMGAPSTKIPAAVGQAHAEVSFTQGPVVLILNSHYPVNWTVNAKSGVQLERIVLTGEQHCTIENPPDGVDIVDQSGKAVASNPLSIGMVNPSYARNPSTFQSRFGMNFTTLNAVQNAPGLSVEVGPGNDSWLAQYVIGLMQKDYDRAIGN